MALFAERSAVADLNSHAESLIEYVQEAFVQKAEPCELTVNVPFIVKVKNTVPELFFAIQQDILSTGGWR